VEHVNELYNADYVATYLGDYHFHPFWRPKVEENQRQLAALFDEIPRGGVWLDLCCGAAQHFAGARADLRCIGLDGSAAQIDTAHRLHANKPHKFVVGDIRGPMVQQLPKADLITVFWGALSYLSTTREWRDVLAVMAAKLNKGGQLYIENPAVAVLLQFNDSSFAGSTGFRVLDVRPDAEPGFHRWAYADRSGMHELLTPDFATLRDFLAAVGLTAQCVGVVQAVEQVIAAKTS
jgi:hypothetical protein